MTKAARKNKLLALDPTRYLTDDTAVEEYLTAVVEANDPNLLLLALGDIARARRHGEIRLLGVH